MYHGCQCKGILSMAKFQIMPKNTQIMVKHLYLWLLKTSGMANAIEAMSDLISICNTESFVFISKKFFNYHSFRKLTRREASGSLYVIFWNYGRKKISSFLSNAKISTFSDFSKIKPKSFIVLFRICRDSKS